jgi:hypothetical protein
MDCRTFHRKLEDYLEGGLDFSGRFGMERHAQQCLGCGKELSDALELRRMAAAMTRVKAPDGFEASVLKEIALRKAKGRYSGFRRLWIYGFEWPSLRKLAMASTSLAIVALAIAYFTFRGTPEQVSEVPHAVKEPARVAAKAEETAIVPAPSVKVAVPKKKSAEIPALAKNDQPAAAPNTDELERQDLQQADYLEYMMTGPDNRAVPVRLPLPKVIPVRYGQMSEDYFIQNVSH